MRKNKQHLRATIKVDSVPVKGVKGVLRELNFDGTQVIEVEGRRLLAFPPATMTRARVGQKVLVRLIGEDTVAKVEVAS